MMALVQFVLRLGADLFRSRAELIAEKAFLRREEAAASPVSTRVTTPRAVFCA
jgi:hypothetical protein